MAFWHQLCVPSLCSEFCGSAPLVFWYRSRWLLHSPETWLQPSSGLSVTQHMLLLSPWEGHVLSDTLQGHSKECWNDFDCDLWCLVSCCYKSFPNAVSLWMFWHVVKQRTKARRRVAELSHRRWVAVCRERGLPQRHKAQFFPGPAAHPLEWYWEVTSYLQASIRSSG